MLRLKMSENLKEAVTFIEQVRVAVVLSTALCRVSDVCLCSACMQGHVRCGPEVVTDPAFLVTRSMEDFVTWVDSSKIKRTLLAYNDAIDDYELQGN